jgi:hypothetical protein
MYHYVYYSYEEWDRGYIGVRSCKCLPEADLTYLGSYSDKTFAPTEKIIIAEFESREQALQAEIDLHSFYRVHVNPHFANKASSTSTFFSVHGNLQSEQQVAKKRESLLKFKEENPEVFETQQQRRLQAIRAWKDANPELLKQNCSKAGKMAAKHLDSIQGAREKGLQKCQQYFRDNPEAMSARGRKGCANTNKQRWQCTVTGYISNSGALSHYQRARGIDTANRVRLPESLEQADQGYTGTESD